MLTSWPTDDVSVTVTTPANSDLSVDESELFFFEDEWNVAQTVTVTAAHDTGSPADESVAITHDADGGDYTSLAVQSVAVTIEDDDVLASVTADAPAVAEGGDATFSVLVERGAVSDGDVALTYSVTGSATPGEDYTAPSGSLTLLSGETTATITIATLADEVLEPGETLIVTLTAVSTTKGSAEFSSAPAAAVIADAGTVAVSVGPASAAEGSAMSFPVTLTGEVSTDVVLGWSTAAGTATSGTDYTAVMSGSLTIEAGDTSGTLTVSTTADTLTESDETFTVTITATTLPSGVSLGMATATGTIEDDDVPAAPVATRQRSYCGNAGRRRLVDRRAVGRDRSGRRG